MNNGSSPVGIHLRAFNWGLWNARRDKGLTQVELAGIVALPLHTISQLECLQRWPTDAQAQDIADALGVTEDAIFPLELSAAVSQKLPSSIRFAVPLKALAGVVEVPQLEDGVAKDELREAVAQVVATLSEREQRVLRLRFGLDDGVSRTYEQVALLMPNLRGDGIGVTRERIRQIEARALRRLRLPSRGRALLNCMKEVDYVKAGIR